MHGFMECFQRVSVRDIGANVIFGLSRIGGLFFVTGISGSQSSRSLSLAFSAAGGVDFISAAGCLGVLNRSGLIAIAGESRGDPND